MREEVSEKIKEKQRELEREEQEISSAEGEMLTDGEETTQREHRRP